MLCSNLSCGIETDHKDSHLLLAEHTLPYSRKMKTHCYLLFVAEIINA
jgi:hypothetical protein